MKILYQTLMRRCFPPLSWVNRNQMSVEYLQLIMLNGFHQLLFHETTMHCKIKRNTTDTICLLFAALLRDICNESFTYYPQNRYICIFCYKVSYETHVGFLNDALYGWICDLYQDVRVQIRFYALIKCSAAILFILSVSIVLFTSWAHQ